MLFKEYKEKIDKALEALSACNTSFTNEEAARMSTEELTNKVGNKQGIHKARNFLEEVLFKDGKLIGKASDDKEAIRYMMKNNLQLYIIPLDESKPYGKQEIGVIYKGVVGIVVNHAMNFVEVVSEEDMKKYDI